MEEVGVGLPLGLPSCWTGRYGARDSGLEQRRGNEI